MIDKQELHNDLVEFFIHKEYAQIYPRKDPSISGKDSMKLYHNDTVFNSRIRLITSQVMRIIEVHEGG